jgi:CheY-specific phosphatase CheX
MAMNGPVTLDRDQEATLRAMVTDACIEMFTSSGFSVRTIDLIAPVMSRAHDIAGFIGFGGAVRGSLMVAGPKQLFERTSPLSTEVGRLSEAELFDWTGEMANQLLGRIKRRFCGAGREFHASTPTAVGGRELGRRFPLRAGIIDLVFSVGGDVLSVCFEITPPPDGKIFPDDAKAIDVSAEGELVLF